MNLKDDVELVERVAMRRNGTGKPYVPVPQAIINCPCGTPLALSQTSMIVNRRCVCGRQYTMSAPVAERS